MLNKTKLILIFSYILLMVNVLAENPSSTNYILKQSNFSSGDAALVSSNYILQSSSIEIVSSEEAVSDNYKILPGYYHGKITDGILAPENVTISTDGVNIQLSWDPVPDATSYKVFSSDDPVIDFTEDTSGTFINESWSTSIPQGKIFYYVKAIKQ